MVHELTHLSKNHTPFGHDASKDEYLFQLQARKPFPSYGQEQQAEIVAFYYTFARDYERLAKLLAETPDKGVGTSHEGMMRQFCNDLHAYTDMMQRVLPVTLPKGCQKPSLP